MLEDKTIPKEEILIEKVIYVNRVTKVVKGGKRFSFSALVVVGNGQGSVGVGMGKATEVAEAIKKGSNRAKKNFISFPLKNTTIPHQIIGVFGKAKVLLKPACEGTGVIAGKTVRMILEAGGIKNILTKSLGSNTPCNVVYAIIDGLIKLKHNEEIIKLREQIIENNKEE